MKSVYYFAATAAISLIIGSGAAAQNLGNGEINPWQQCGLGAAVFPDNGTAAAISNVIWDLGTTAVTSAAASPESCSGNTVKAAAFIQRTHDPLIAETSIGEGEHLDTLLTGIACDEDVKKDVIAHLRAEMAVEVQKASYVKMDHDSKAEAYFMALRDVVKANFVDSCESV